MKGNTRHWLLTAAAVAFLALPLAGIAGEAAESDEKAAAPLEVSFYFLPD